jgi:rhodanese-related sulfurtransferase
MNATPFAPIEPSQAEAAISRNAAAQLIDVREYSEWAADHVPGARLLPLSTLRQSVASLGPGPIYLLCRTGNRAAQAEQMMQSAGHADVHVIAGGLIAWKAAGLPCERGAGRVWSLERQVRFTAGALVLAGLAGSILLSPWCAILSAGIGGGLILSAATDTCAMGLLLARMPWNRASQTRSALAPEISAN